jgi:hypothetical protein
MRIDRESDSNEIHETEQQNPKYGHGRISTLGGISID